jgi:propanediol dehydratase large subunit
MVIPVTTIGTEPVFAIIKGSAELDEPTLTLPNAGFPDIDGAVVPVPVTVKVKDGVVVSLDGIVMVADRYPAFVTGVKVTVKVADELAGIDDREAAEATNSPDVGEMAPMVRVAVPVFSIVNVFGVGVPRDWLPKSLDPVPLRIF